MLHKTSAAAASSASMQDWCMMQPSNQTSARKPNHLTTELVHHVRSWTHNLTSSAPSTSHLVSHLFVSPQKTLTHRGVTDVARKLQATQAV